MTNAVRSKYSFSTLLDTPRKMYFRRIATIIEMDVENKVETLERYKRDHGETIFVNGEFQSIDEMIQIYSFIQHLVNQATSVSELRIVREHLDIENKTHEDVFETIRIVSIFSDRRS